MPTFKITEPIPSKPSIPQPRGRPRKGHKWIDGEWVKTQTNDQPTTTKPRGRPPKGKIWDLTQKKYIDGPPKVKFLKVVDKNGKVKFRIKPITSVAKKTTTTTTKPKTKPAKKNTGAKTPLKPGMNQKQLNKFLHNSLKMGKTDGIKEALERGASLAYFNFEGICEAAEFGHIEIFKIIFEQLPYQNLIDKDLGDDLIESAIEDGHDDLAEYIRQFSSNLLENIPEQNLNGMDDYDE